MNTSDINSDITYLTGVGPKRAELFAKELNIVTFNDLLYHYPFRYVDRTKFYTLAEVNADLPYIQAKGKIMGFRYEGEGAKQRLIADFKDQTGAIELVWFKGLKRIPEMYKTGVDYIAYGKPSEFKSTVKIVHPEIEDPTKLQEQSFNAILEPVYNTTEALKKHFVTSKTIHKLEYNLLKIVKDQIIETLPPYLLKKLNMLSLSEALFNIHFPQNNDLLRKAEYRLKFEELFYIQLRLLRKKNLRTTQFSGFVFSKIGDNFNTFYSKYLPFELTNAQKRVIKEIRKNLGVGKQMNRLLQGDVGSGKTLVALMCMLIALDNNFQACLMAPTEILAQQHYNSIKKMLGDMNVTVAILTGSTKKKLRTSIHQQLLSGELQIIIGTHALIEDVVAFKNLGFVVIDEQHRFGVAQRAKLWGKNTSPPHILVMTATPIPRTLAMTLYGDLDISVIDELPPGRQPIKTYHFYDSQRLKLFGFLKQQISQGRQVYIVYPLISESEKLDLKYLEDGYESIVQSFPAPQYAVSVMHGKMKSAEKEKSMWYFQDGQTHIMVATTVIEVGVDVPNASVMVIESAERFGLSQLHQLRGRVGRGAEQSFCILMTPFKLSADARKRLEIFVATNDGFEIAEADMRLRGPGDLDGTQQSGLPIDLKIADLSKDTQLLEYSRAIATDILKNDPTLIHPDNAVLVSTIKRLKKKRVNWGIIS